MDITELQNGVKIINDAYNASLESMQASLKYLSELKQEIESSSSDEIDSNNQKIKSYQ